MIKKMSWSKILSKHCYEILEQIFMEEPPDIPWFEILCLFEELTKIEEIGGDLWDTPGAPVSVRLDTNVIGVFDELDPNQITAKFNIPRVRKLLLRVGVVPSPHSKKFFLWRFKQ